MSRPYRARRRTLGASRRIRCDGAPRPSRVAGPKKSRAQRGRPPTSTKRRPGRAGNLWTRPLRSRRGNTRAPTYRPDGNCTGGSGLARGGRRPRAQGTPRPRSSWPSSAAPHGLSASSPTGAGAPGSSTRARRALRSPTRFRSQASGRTPPMHGSAWAARTRLRWHWPTGTSLLSDAPSPSSTDSARARLQPS